MSLNPLRVAILAAIFSTSLHAQEQPSMKEQAKQDWQDIRETAGEVKDATVKWGKSVGKKAKELGQDAADVAKDLGGKARVKANELTEKARDAAENDAAEQNSEGKKPGSRFFY